MLLVAITPERAFAGEAEAITQVLSSGFSYVHLRMPLATADEARAVMRGIDPALHERITLASHYELIDEFGFGGVHLKKGVAIDARLCKGLRTSRSFHRGDDFTGIDKLSYGFLSPIFNSISKAGYQSAFNVAELHGNSAIAPHLAKLVALGGITASNVAKVKQAGFGGAAMLGYIFTRPKLLDERLKLIKEQLNE